MSETSDQMVVVRWLRKRGICFAHVPNGGGRNAREGATLKVLGVSAGVPDILIFDRPPNKPEKVGLALEMKRAVGGQVSRDQRGWLDALEARGWEVAVCHGEREAADKLMTLGYG